MILGPKIAGTWDHKKKKKSDTKHIQTSFQNGDTFEVFIILLKVSLNSRY